MKLNKKLLKLRVGLIYIEFAALLSLLMAFVLSHYFILLSLYFLIAVAAYKEKIKEESEASC